MNGWQCPKCGNCYAPWVWECAQCNTKPAVQRGATVAPVTANLCACSAPNLDSSARCSLCGGLRMETR